MEINSQNPAFFINPYNASIALRYLLSFNLNALDEKHLKLGIQNIIDLPKTKHLCFLIEHTNTECLEVSKELVNQTINLTNVLNDEAKQNLFEYLAMHKKL